MSVYKFFLYWVIMRLNLFLALFITYYIFKYLIFIYILQFLFWTLWFFYIIFIKMLYLKTPMVLNAPTYYNDGSWFSTIISIFFFRPRLIVYKGYYFLLFKYFFKNQKISIFNYFILFVWILFYILTGVSKILLYIIFFFFKFFFSLDKSNLNFKKNINKLFLGDYEIFKDLRIIYENNLWINPLLNKIDYLRYVLKANNISPQSLTKFKKIIEMKSALIDGKIIKKSTVESFSLVQSKVRHEEYNVSNQFKVTRTHTPLPESFGYGPDITQREQYLVPVDNSNIHPNNFFDNRILTLQQPMYYQVQNAVVYYSTKTNFKQFVNYSTKPADIITVEKKDFVIFDNSLLNEIDKEVIDISLELNCNVKVINDVADILFTCGRAPVCGVPFVIMNINDFVEALK